MASWAAKYQESGLEVLYDQSRSGRPIEIAGDQRAKITALAFREPPEGYARWSLRLLADKVVELEYCEHISHTEVNEILTPALVCGACTAVDNREIWFDLSEGRLLVRRRNRSPRRRSARQKDKVEREGTVLRAKNKKHFCGIDQAEKFGKLLWATGCTVGADRARIFVFICDGANWIWNLIAFYFPNAVQIVDWYHAADRLHRIAVEVFSDLTERQAWLRVITKYLWQG